jgi:hypothetical protein
MAEPSGLTPGTIADTLPRQQTQFGWSDPLSVLPSGPSERLRQCQQRYEDRRNLLPSFEDRKAAGDAKRAAEQRLHQLTAHPQEFGHGLPENHPSVIVAKRQLEQATAAAARIDDLHKVRSADLRAAGDVLSNVTSWLRDGRPAGTVLEAAVEVEPPKLQKGEDVVAAIERLRRRGRELKADLARISAAPFPSSHVKAQLRAQLEQLATPPDVSMMIEHDGAIVWPTKRVQSQVISAEGGLAFHEAVDVVGLLVFLLKPAVISAALDALVDAEKDDAASLSHEAREISASEAQNDLIDVERMEAELVFRGQREGLAVEHRADISPLALLGVRLVTAPHAAAPGSSAAMVIDYIGPRSSG